MASCLFAPINWLWEGTPAWSGGSWTLPLANLATADTLAYARSASTDPAATRFTVDFGTPRRFDTVALAWHNASAAGKVRLTAAGAPPDFDHDFTTGTLPAGWTFARPSPGTCFGPDGLLRTVAAGAPRFDHDPITGAPRGLLIEEARTNLIAHSNDLAAWMSGSTNASVSPSAGAALDGTSSADEVTCLGPGSRRIAFNSYLGATTYTWSLVITPIVGTTIDLVIVNAELGFPEIGIDVAAGTIVSATGSRRGQGVRDLGSGRKLVWLSWTTIGPGLSQTELRFRNVGDRFLVSDAQIEVGSFPSTRIPTSGSTQSRAADSLFTNTLGLSWWQSHPVSLHARVRRPFGNVSMNAGTGNFSPALSAWDGVAHSVAEIGLSPEYAGPHTAIRALAGYFLGPGFGGSEVAENTSVSIAASFQSGSSAMALDGSAAGASSASYASAPATTLHVGGTPGAARLDGWVERVSIWAARLADERLATGTADWHAFSGVEWQSGWLDLVPVVHAPVDGRLPFGRESADGKLPADERDPRGATFLHVLAAPVSARALTVELDDPANPAGFLQASLLFVAQAERPAPNIARGVSVGAIEEASRARSLAGGLHARRRWRRRRIAGALAAQRGARALATWLELARRAGGTRPILFCLDPDAGIQRDRGTLIGVLVDPAPIEHVEHDRWGWTFAIEEI